MSKYVEKRDGTVVKFDTDKIINAIVPAMKEANNLDYWCAVDISKKIYNNTQDKTTVENIQDMVERELMAVYPETAKRYILYRNERTKLRNMKSDLIKHIKEKLFATNVQNTNANVDERSFGAKMAGAAEVLLTDIAANEMLDPDVRKAKEDNLLYIHDFTHYALGDHNCLNVPIDRILKNGFETRNADIRKANSLSSACQLVAVIMQTVSMGQFGGCGSLHIDTDLAPFVRISFLKHFKDGLKYLCKDKNKNYNRFVEKYNDKIYTASIIAYSNIFKDYHKASYEYARDMLEKEGKQANEALVHNLNSLESRSGMQLPFVSLSAGIDTSFEGRCETRWLYEAQLNGIGKYNKTPIFPILIHKYKKDINDRPGTPNYDLFKLAIKSTAKRIYPNYVNCDWVSNTPDIHPTYLVSKPALNGDVLVTIQTQNKENTKLLDIKEISLSEFVNICYTKYKDNIKYREEDKFFYIDLRFINEPIYIYDETSEYKDYHISLSDRVSKINYISFLETGKLYSITTDTFRHNYSIKDSDTNEVYTSEYIDYKYDYNTEMSTMGCRTLIGYDRHGQGWSKQGRGNVAPATMNLAKLGIQYGTCLGERKEPDLDGFLKALDNLMNITEKSLIDRFNYISSQSPKSAWFDYINNIMIDTEESIKHNKTEFTMKHNTLAMGFVGLPNALYALFGKYQNQDDKVKEFGNIVVKRIYEYTKEASERNNLNFSCYATPAESCSYTIMLKLKKEFGIIKGVTDREYLVNSYHVPPYEKVSIRKKIDIESEYTKYCTGGNITYIEFDADVMKNVNALEAIIKYAMEKNNHQIAYFAINFPIDNCNNCGFSGVIDEDCPKCGSSDIQRLRRVTGYLTADYKTRFNKGKKAEVEERVKHTKYSNISDLIG